MKSLKSPTACAVLIDTLGRFPFRPFFLTKYNSINYFQPVPLEDDSEYGCALSLECCTGLHEDCYELTKSRNNNAYKLISPGTVVPPEVLFDIKASRKIQRLKDSVSSKIEPESLDTESMYKW
ncbi:hypothetical protein Tco_0133956 [Tanacetum coccineum]